MKTLRNVGWNLMGLIAPLLAAAIVTPVLLRSLQLQRFGILTLAWMIVGYFTLFDFGVGRALTKVLSERLAQIGAVQDNAIRSLVWTGLFTAIGLGILGAAVLALLSPLIVHHLLSIPLDLQPEALRAFLVIAASVPFVVCSSALRGVLEANRHFALSSGIRAVMGVWTFVGPLVALRFWPTLPIVMASLLVGRLVGSCILFFTCRRQFPSVFERPSFDMGSLRTLLGFGGWMTISNVVSPIMVSMDRFFIGALLSLAAVAHYATPFELISKVLIIPTAIVGVLFPEFSSRMVGSRESCILLYRRASLALLCLLAPILAVVALFSQAILSVWLGAAFASQSYRVLEILAIGVAINGLAFIPFALLQATGRPDITAKFHLVELPVYVLFVLVLTRQFGIVGTAVAWFLRVMIDQVLLQYAVRRQLATRAEFFRDSAPVLVALALLACAELLPTGAPRIGVVAIVFGSAAATLWFRGLDDRTRAFLLARTRLT